MSDFEIVFIPGKSLKKELAGKKTYWSNKIKRKSVNFFKRVCLECRDVYETKSYKGKYCYACKVDKGLIKSNNKYSGRFVRLRKAIMARDGYKCQCCEMDENRSLSLFKRQLSVHHIDGNTRNNKLENLITLCGQCHISLTGQYGAELYTADNIRDLFPKEIVRGKHGNRLVYKPS